MSKLTNSSLELSYLKAICDISERDKGIACAMLSVLDDSYFFSPVSKIVFEKLRKTYDKTGNIINFDLIATDTNIKDEDKDIIKSIDNVNINEKNYREAFNNLDILRKGRALQSIAQSINDKLLAGDTTNLEKLFNDTVRTLTNSQTAKEDEDCYTIIGKGENYDGKMMKLLSGQALKFMPSGFNGWDSRNNGLPLGKLGIVAATSGGGKSLMGIQLALNVANYGNAVCVVPLEMNSIDMLHRIAANKTHLTMSEIAKGKDIDRENRLRAFKALKAYSKTLENKNASITIYNPKDDLDMEGLLLRLDQKRYDMVIIDYIGLLKGFEGDNQWRKMSEAMRTAKVWAESRMTTVIVMAQLNDDMMLKFSKSMKDHADLMWSWNPGKISQLENGEAIIRIEPQKGRNQEQAVFYLHSSFKKMQMYDATPDEITAYETKMKAAGDGKGFNNARGQKFIIDGGKSKIKV